MKNLFSLTLVALATLAIACGGNANRPAAEEATEDVVIEEVAEIDECCEKAENCEETAECEKEATEIAQAE